MHVPRVSSGASLGARPRCEWSTQERDAVPMEHRSMLRAALLSSVLLAFASPVSAQVVVHEVPLSRPFDFGQYLSRDGSTVVGVLASGMAGRWRPNTGLVEMGGFLPIGIDAGGNVACGVPLDTTQSVDAYRWSAFDGVLPIAPPKGFDRCSMYAVSGGLFGGSLVVGGVQHAASWSSFSGFRAITVSPGATWSAAVDVSQNQVVAGNWQDSAYRFGSFWSFGSYTQLLQGPGGSQCWIWSCSPMGNYFVGTVPIPGDPYSFVPGIPHRACVWSPGNGVSVLPMLANTQRADARATSEWGTVIVGTCSGAGVGYRATVWGAAQGPIDLTRYVQCRATGVDPGTLTVAHAVSADGRVILASGANGRLYLITGFTLPEGPRSDLNSDGATDGYDLATLLECWGSASTQCPADLNADGVVNADDLTILLARWGSCP